MSNSSIEQVLDEAVELVLNGADPQLCAELFPALRNKLEPLLQAVAELRAYASDCDHDLEQAEASRRSIDWAELLADVPQADAAATTAQPAWAAPCVARRSTVPTGRRAGKLRVVHRERTILH